MPARVFKPFIAALLLGAAPLSVARAVTVDASVLQPQPAERAPSPTPDAPPPGPGVSATPSNNTTPVTSGPTTPNSPPTSFGLFPEFGADLLAHGVDLHGIIFDHPLFNPTAGIIRGQSSNLGGFSPAADFDLGKLFGWHGSYIHIQPTIFFGKDNIPRITTQTGGFLTGFQTTPVPSGINSALSVLSFEQRLGHDKLSIEIGHTNLTVTSCWPTRWSRSPTIPAPSRSTATSIPCPSRYGAGGSTTT